MRCLIVRWLCDKAPPKSYKSLSQRILISTTHLKNVECGRYLVNKSVKLSHDLFAGY
jgi:hypothetical protein